MHKLNISGELINCFQRLKRQFYIYLTDKKLFIILFGDKIEVKNNE